MRAIKVLAAASGIALALGVPLAAQQHPNVERGFSPEKLYQFGDLDNVSLFNGNLNLTIPLGRRYRSPDGEVELLVIKAGVCDLRYNGAAMDVLQPKILPSAD